MRSERRIWHAQAPRAILARYWHRLTTRTTSKMASATTTTRWRGRTDGWSEGWRGRCGDCTIICTARIASRIALIVFRICSCILANLTFRRLIFRFCIAIRFSFAIRFVLILVRLPLQLHHLAAMCRVRCSRFGCRLRHRASHALLANEPDEAAFFLQCNAAFWRHLLCGHE